MLVASVRVTESVTGGFACSDEVPTLAHVDESVDLSCAAHAAILNSILLACDSSYSDDITCGTASNWNGPSAGRSPHPEARTGA